MDFLQATDNLDVHKCISLLFAVVFGGGSMMELFWPGTVPITVDEKTVGPQDGPTYYAALYMGVLLGVAALALFGWLHRRVQRVIASEAGLQISTGAVRFVNWAGVSAVKKALPNLLNGFYLVSLSDGTTFYTPIEREAPRLSTLGTWYDASASLEQLCIKKGVWVH